MPLSRRNRCIFIHIPKTAGTSVAQALTDADPQMEYAGSGLWQLLMSHSNPVELFNVYRRTFRVATLAYEQQQHLPAAVLRHLVGEQTWQSSFKFAFVRNPWDMLVSGYHYQIDTLTEEQRMLNPDVHALLNLCRDFSDVVRCYPMIRADMTSFLTDERGELLVDFVGRYENLENDFAYVCRRIGINAELGHMNRSDHDAYRQYYTQETRAIVARHFARDIERFGYEF